MTDFIQSTQLLGMNIEQAENTASQALGTTTPTGKGGRVMYVQASANLVRYTWVAISPLYVASATTAALAVKNDGSCVQFDVSSGQYFWTPIAGQFYGKASAASSDIDKKLYTNSAGAGTIGTTSGGSGTDRELVGLSHTLTAATTSGTDNFGNAFNILKGLFVARNNFYGAL